jgi:hypothetical protein
MERLAGSYLTAEALTMLPLHPNQHNYQAGKSVETTFQQRGMGKGALPARDSLGCFLRHKWGI